jgi:uncharacterized repeat protein (TIGR01451 family)
MKDRFSHLLFLIAFLVLAMLLVFHSGSRALQTTQAALAMENGANWLLLNEELRQEVAKYGQIPIIIGLDVPSHRSLAQADDPLRLEPRQIEQISQDIALTAGGLLGRLSQHNISQIKQYDYFPLLAMIVDEAALAALAADTAVTHISLDVPVAPAMDDTIPLIRANNTHFLNYTGSGWSVAVLDTGVDKFHPALAGKVVSEACYSSNVPAAGATSLCPGGATSSTATNSGLHCAVGIAGCDHGTHVAGIAARVAPAAKIVAIQVFSRFTDSGSNTSCQNANRTSPCTLTYRSDQVAGLNRVFALHISSNGIQIASANMSLGGGRYFIPCDPDNSFFSLLLAINQLRDQTIATVISAGNDGYRDSMGGPACLSPAISVASSDKANVISSFSNISIYTTLIAPGSAIVAPVPQTYSPIYQQKGGTSMAAPHVAGAIATFKEARPNATVPQIISALTNSALPTVSDTRSGGSVTKRRLDAWTSACALISCDNDDFRTISSSQTLNGAMTPVGDVDHYYYHGTAGQRLTLRMNRTSGSMDPYLELFSPGGVRVAFNDNGGGGVNALINGYLLPQNGLYQIRARSLNNFTGSYQLISSTESVPLNPTPSINFVTPSSVTGTFFGSDFWVAIYGSNFMPESQVRWNGQLRAKFYSSSTLIYIRVLGSDIGWPWPRNAFITVQNPTPGGGTSNSRAFSINTPFLGESSMLFPETGSSVSAGVSQSFVISWTAPAEVGTWRDMQYMDMRLRNEAGETAAWVRVVEQPGTGSFYRLLNASGEMVDEGLPGEGRTLVLTDTVSLQLADSAFAGSGLTAVMTPSLTFGPAAVGVYNVEFRVDSNSGEDDEANVQDTDVLGVFTILPAGCNVAIADVSLSGDSVGLINTPYVFSTAVSPPTASTPISYSWAPEPASGQGFANGVYSFDRAGEYIISVGAENCGAFAAAIHTIQISSGPNPDLALTKAGPATAAAGQPITYTLTVTNSGASTATNLLVKDILPAGATYVSGGTLVGNEVRWSISELAGFGGVAEVAFVVTAATDLTNSSYSVTADGGYSASGSPSVATQKVDAQVVLTAVTTHTLAYGGTSALIPGGSVFAETTLTYKQLSAPGYPLAGYAGRAFNLVAYQANTLLSDFQLSETVEMIITYSPADVAGLNLNLLALLYWQDGRWSSSGVSCQTNTAANQVSCQIANPPLTQYALAEAVQYVYLPLTTNNFPPTTEHVQITGLLVAGSQYQVSFQTYHFQPHVEHTHIHFFFNTVPPEQAGVPGSGPWYVYGGSSPFTGYGPADRPAGATQLCALVANHDHSIRLNSGNCYNLP